MPEQIESAKLDRCVADVMSQGRSEQSAFAICRAALGEAEWPDDADDEIKTYAIGLLSDPNLDDQVQEAGIRSAIAKAFQIIMDAARGSRDRPTPPASPKKESATVVEAELVEVGDAPALGRLVEKAVRRDGTIAMKVIEPGWGSSGFYSREVLERDGPAAFPAGTQQFWNHPTDMEEMERPEGDLNSLAAVLVSDARWQESGPEGPGLYADAQVFGSYQAAVDELAPHIGVSIRAQGTTHAGQAEGRRGPIIDSIDHGRSIDFVTMPGAGGRVVALFEAKRGLNKPAVEEPIMTTPENTELTEAQARIEKLEALVEAERQSRIASQAKALVYESLRTCGLPDAAVSRLWESAAVNPPVTESQELDVDALKARVAEAVQAETAYIQTIAGTSPVRGMGPVVPNKDIDYSSEMEKAYRDIGLSESAAKIAAAGR